MDEHEKKARELFYEIQSDDEAYSVRLIAAALREVAQEDEINKLKAELQAAREQKDDTLRDWEIARLREQLRLANIDAANNEAEANDARQALEQARGEQREKDAEIARRYKIHAKWTDKSDQKREVFYDGNDIANAILADEQRDVKP